MKRKEQLIQRRWDILTVSLNLFITKGYYGTSTREIAQIAGISSGLMFHYFKNKENLYHSLIEIGTEKMIFDLKKGVENPKMYLETVVKTILEQLQSNDFFAKMFVFIDDAQHTIGIPEESKELLRSIDSFHQCTSIIESGQEKGMFRKGNAHALCVTFLGAIQGIAQEKVRVPDTPMPETAWLMSILY